MSTVNTMSSKRDTFSALGYYISDLVMQSEGGLFKMDVTILAYVYSMEILFQCLIITFKIFILIAFSFLQGARNLGCAGVALYRFYSIPINVQKIIK